ncbi:MAG: catechol 1,2-dioxygenase [Actinomycetota bacterium]|nr:catechol 1,2-dioxygenase [Actinomycetota bacterium]
MGEVVGAALVAHVPTIMLPEDVRLELNEGKEISLVPGLQRMKRDCIDRLKPDTVIVFDTHWESTFEHIVTAQDRRQGLFTSSELPRGMRQIPYDMPGDPDLAKRIAAQAEGRDDCWILASDDPYLPIFYGTVNIWTFLGDPDTRWLSVALNQCCDTDDFLLLGSLIGKAIAESDRRVVLLASGGMTHRFFGFKELRQREAQRAPDNIYDRAYYDADMHVLDLMQRGDHAGVIDNMPTYRKAYPEGHFGHYLMMAAAMGGAGCRAPGERFSEYEASVGTGQVHVWFERPAEGWTGAAEGIG